MDFFCILWPVDQYTFKCGKNIIDIKTNEKKTLQLKETQLGKYKGKKNDENHQRTNKKKINKMQEKNFAERAHIKFSEMNEQSKQQKKNAI